MGGGANQSSVMISNRSQEIHDHVQRFFAGHKINERRWAESYVSDLYPDFSVLEIEPGPRSGNWNYVSSGTWKTAQEINVSYYTIERSVDGIRWATIGNDAATRHSSAESSYSFTDYKPVSTGLYRIVEHDVDDGIQYSNVIHSSCIAADVFSIFPNPVHENLFIDIVTNSESQALIKLFNSNGTLVKVQKATVLQGSKHLSVDVKLFAKGIYHLSVEWNNGQIQKTMQVVKQ